jgi:hypothetical protein
MAGAPRICHRNTVCTVDLETGAEGAHFHGLYCIMCLLDGVDCQPLGGVWQKELIDDLYLVIRQPDGSQCISHELI